MTHPTLPPSPRGSAFESIVWSRRSLIVGSLAVAGAAVVPTACTSAGERRGQSGGETNPQTTATTSAEALDQLDRDIIVLVADRGNQRIRAITPDGSVSTFAGATYGYLEGPRADALFAFPFAVSAHGPIVVVSDQGNDRVRMIERGQVSSLAGGNYGFEDGPGPTARFRQPYGVYLDDAGTTFVADTANHRIRRIEPDGTVSTIAGGDRGYLDGTAAEARFDEPSDVAIADDGGLLVADRANHRIRRIDPDGTVSTVAGSGVGSQDGGIAEATFNRPTSLALRPDGTIVVSDILNHRIREISADGIVRTFAGGIEGTTDGPPDQAGFRLPAGLAIAPSGRVYVADRENHRIRRVDPDGTVSTVAGDTEGFADGTSTAARFSFPYDVAVATGAVLQR